MLKSQMLIRDYYVSGRLFKWFVMLRGEDHDYTISGPYPRRITALRAENAIRGAFEDGKFVVLHTEAGRAALAGEGQSR